MKKLLMAILVMGAWAGMALIARRLIPEDKAASTTQVRTVDETTATHALREEILHATWQELGIRPRDGVWGVLMELGFAKGVATVVALADGTASLYLSTGGSAMRGDAHRSTRDAAVKLCDTAAAIKQETTATTTYPMPSAKQVRFYVLTDAGVRTAQADEASLRAGKNQLSPLYTAGQDVITGLREASGMRSAQ